MWFGRTAMAVLHPHAYDRRPQHRTRDLMVFHGSVGNVDLRLRRRPHSATRTTTHKVEYYTILLLRRTLPM